MLQRDVKIFLKKLLAVGHWPLALAQLEEFGRAPSSTHPTLTGRAFATRHPAHRPLRAQTCRSITHARVDFEKFVYSCD